MLRGNFRLRIHSIKVLDEHLLAVPFFFPPVNIKCTMKHSFDKSHVDVVHGVNGQAPHGIEVRNFQQRTSLSDAKQGFRGSFFVGNQIIKVGEIDYAEVMLLCPELVGGS